MIDPGSIYIFDNGSTEPQVLAILAQAEIQGIQVIRRHAQPSDYFDCGTIFAKLIRQLDKDDPHDFYFPMDCDEFIACNKDGKISCHINDIEVSLKTLLGSKKVLTIPHKLCNSPYHPNRYSRITWCNKCFFAQDACESLAHGFHEARSRSGAEQVKSLITYVEFHYKPYQEHRRLSQQKISFLLPDMKRTTLRNYSKTKRSNHHAASVLLQSEYAYIRSFRSQPETFTDTALLQRFDQLGIDSSPLFDTNIFNSPIHRILLLLKHVQLKFGDEAVKHWGQTRNIASKLKRSLMH